MKWLQSTVSSCAAWVHGALATLAAQTGMGVAGLCALAAGALLFIIALVLFIASRSKKQAAHGTDADLRTTQQTAQEAQQTVQDLQQTVQALQQKEAQLTQALAEKTTFAADLQQKLELAAKNADPAQVAKFMADAKFTELQNQARQLDREVQNLQQQLAATQKKLKKAEDDLGDAEDDCETAEKKLKQKNEAYATLQKAFDEEKTAHTQTKAALEEKAKDLSDKEKVLTTKVGTLEFMSSILLAPDVADADLNARYRTIDTVKSYVQNELKTCLEKNGITVEEKDKNLFGDALDQWEQVSKKTWLKNKIAVAFVGEFSAGKTSIVNSIILANNPEAHKLPTSTKATTAIPTYISASTTGVESYYFVTPDNKLKVLNPAVFSVTKEMLDSVDGEETLFKYFVVSYNNEALTNLSILDTPGFSSSDKKDAERTIEVINECDALFWVIDVNNGTANRSSLKTIKEHLKKPLYVVINKIDSKPPSEVDTAEALITKTFADEGIHVQSIIRYSNDASVVPPSTIIDVLSQVKRTNVSNYIEALRSYTDRVLSAQNANCNAALSAWKACSNAVDGFRDTITSELNKIAEDCNDAYYMPQFKERLIRANIYEMSEATGDRLRRLLSTIANDEVKALGESINNSNQAVQDYQKATERYESEKRKKDSLETCISGLERHLRAVK